MSDDTKAALDSALRTHVADEYPDNLVGGYVIIVERVLPEDDDMTHVVDIVPDGQSNITSLGLATFLAAARSARQPDGD